MRTYNITFILVTIADIITTLLLVSIGGEELSPVYKLVGDLNIFFLIKYIYALLVIFIFSYALYRYPNKEIFFKRMYLIGIVATGLFATSNLIQYLIYK